MSSQNKGDKRSLKSWTEYCKTNSTWYYSIPSERCQLLK